MYRCVGTPLALRARCISIDCGRGPRGARSPTKNSVGVRTFATSFNGELFQYASIGAFFCHGVPPNQGVRNDRISLCAYIDIQCAAPAPAAAALKRSVKVMILFVMWPPPLHPIFNIR